MYSAQTWMGAQWLPLAALDGASGSRHGSIPKASVLACDSKRSVLLHFPLGRQCWGCSGRGRSVWVQPHTPETLYHAQVIVLHGVSLLTAPLILTLLQEMKDTLLPTLALRSGLEK